MNEAMGQIIRRLRKNRELTQEELAEQLNVTPQAVSRWESGSGLPDISQVVPIANALGVSTDILFGRSSNGDEEIEAFIKNIEYKFSNKPQGVEEVVWRLECCTEIRKMLSTYPNNYRLLSYSIGIIVLLLWELKNVENDSPSKSEFDYGAEFQKWRSECIRQANVILSYCTEPEYLNEANRWLISVCRIDGDFDKAMEYAKKLPKLKVSLEGGSLLAGLYDDKKRDDDAIKQYSNNILSALNYLEHELPMLGYIYYRQGKYAQAYACYRLYPDIYDLITQNDADKLPFYYRPCYEWCAAACMGLGRHDEALDWLEKWLTHTNHIEMTWRKVTGSDLPYFCGIDGTPYAEVFTDRARIKDSLEWSCFDPIREHPRFQAIASVC